ncbi:aldose epimerase family protein [uncultured Oscillibacter sp.]|uniref:aldose epimerase family protein n=1 Tax=uncultured Oscillibacter sp. TaxID=876091 RepID=UPI0028046E2A|nr:aldose epimerase family protein [uncultured Oscillibacter sp.]
MSVVISQYGQLSTGEFVDLYTLANASGAYVKISALGCAIVSLCVPDRNGVLADVVLGYDTPQEYRSKPKFIGVTVGRYANRIAKGQFSIDQESFQLECNNNGNALHGGSLGFDKQIWTLVGQTENSITLEHISPDGTAGYPGELKVHLTYTFSDDHALTLHYTAVCNRLTICNLTHHCYFNLAGHETADISAQTIQIDSDYIVEVDDWLIPTGTLLPIAGSSVDLNTPVSFGTLHALIGRDPLLTKGKGLDFNYVLPGGSLQKVAEIVDPNSGRVLEVLTDMPGVQAYSGGNLTDEVFGKGGSAYPQHAGFCMETQFYPDAPNHPEFPSTILRPGEVYDHYTTYRFSVQ